MKETIVSDTIVSPLQAELPEALREPTRSKSLLFMVLYMIANMVIGVGNITIATLLLPEHVVLSDRFQRRKLFVIVASAIMAGGLLLYALSPTWSMVLVGTVLMGTGFGVYQAVDLALASQVLLAAADRGKDIGIINAAIFMPMILSPVVAGITLSLLHSYLELFSLLAVVALIAAALIRPIKSVH